uniref:Interleukin-22 n=1 Tax=Melanogrammus aeglefinus TaxID=8056 RepID=B9ZSS4_MELAE|nr:interleukin-22 [Melanogrammus aeglefinus]
MLLFVCFAWLLCSQHSSARPMSDVLHNHDTYQAARDISRKAQKLEAGDDTSLRLISRVSPNQPLAQNAEICCLHANILDFYLLNVLQSSDSFHPTMPRLKTDLARISQDLSHHGCNVTHYHDHQNAVEFREKLITMQGPRGITKAIGEIDILFTYLGEFCVQN